MRKSIFLKEGTVLILQGLINTPGFRALTLTCHIRIQVGYRRDREEVQGSVIKGGQVGDVSFFSTTVEPSKVNRDKYAHLWVTKDGLHWEERYKAKKDCWPAIFQFGTFEFPQYNVEKIDRLYFSGRAVKGLDGKTTYIEL